MRIGRQIVESYEDVDVAVVSMVGEHDLVSLAELEQCLARWESKGTGLVVDLSRCVFLDVATCRMIAAAGRRAASKRKRVVIVDARGWFERLFGLLSLEAELTFVPSLGLGRLQSLRLPSADGDARLDGRPSEGARRLLLAAAVLLDNGDIHRWTGPGVPGRSTTEAALAAAVARIFAADDRTRDACFDRARLALLVSSRAAEDGEGEHPVDPRRTLLLAAERVSTGEQRAAEFRPRVLSRADDALSRAWLQCLAASTVIRRAAQTRQDVRQARARRAA